MSVNLSYSAIELFQLCGQKFNYERVKKLSTNKAYSALLFGTAVDQALNLALESMRDTGTALPLEDALAAFDRAWQFQEQRDGSVLGLFGNTNIEYYKSDFQAEWSGSALVPAGTKAQFEELFELCKSGKPTLAQKKQLNAWCWNSLSTKGNEIIKAFYRDLLPLISKVIDVQVKLELENDCGDKFRGNVDIIVELHGHEGPWIIDNKTSSGFQSYPEDCVPNSKQLGVYAVQKGIKQAGYFIMNKKPKVETAKECQACMFVSNNNRIKKCDQKTFDGERCNGDFKDISTLSIETLVRLGTVEEGFIDGYLDGIDVVADAVKEGRFTRNYNSCMSFGKPCPFQDMCRGKETEEDFRAREMTPKLEEKAE